MKGEELYIKGAGEHVEQCGNGITQGGSFYTLLLVCFNMADMDLLLARLRAAAALRGPDWLEAQVGDLLRDKAGGPRPWMHCRHAYGDLGRRSIIRPALL